MVERTEKYCYWHNSSKWCSAYHFCQGDTRDLLLKNKRRGWKKKGLRAERNMFRTDIVNCVTGDSEMQRVFSSPVICTSPNTVCPDGFSFVTLRLDLMSHCLAS